MKVIFVWKNLSFNFLKLRFYANKDKLYYDKMRQLKMS